MNIYICIYNKRIYTNSHLSKLYFEPPERHVQKISRVDAIIIGDSFEDT